MKTLLILLYIILFTQTTQAGFFSNKCSEGCLVVNGKKIPFWEAETLVSQCDRFRQSSLGRMAVSLSYTEIEKRTNRNPDAPLMNTYFDYVFISESPLVFNRRTKDTNLKYREIVQACVQLKRDFNGDRYWTK